MRNKGEIVPIRHFCMPFRKLPIGKYYVYRYFDKNAALLYVGVTKNFAMRMRENEQKQYWFAETQLTTVESFPEELAAKNAEWLAISEEQPAYNKNQRFGALYSQMRNQGWSNEQIGKVYGRGRQAVADVIKRFEGIVSSPKL